MTMQKQNPGGQAGASHDLLNSAWSPRIHSRSSGRVQSELTERSEKDRQFTHHRQAALALLSECPDLPHKAAGFLGNVCVAPTLSGKQRDWLVKLLDRYNQPPLVEGGMG